MTPLTGGRVQVGENTAAGGGAVEVSEQQSGGIHVGRLMDLRKVSDAVGYGVRWDKEASCRKAVGRYSISQL